MVFFAVEISDYMAVLRCKRLLYILLNMGSIFLFTSCISGDYSDFSVRGEILSISKKHVVIQGDDSVMFLPIDDYNRAALKALLVGDDVTFAGTVIRQRHHSGHVSKVYDVTSIILPDGNRIAFR